MGGGNPNPSKRGIVNGWSMAAVRRHTAWLYSVDTSRLDGRGFAVTLTMLRCPDTAEEFHALRRAYLMRVERMGAIRSHWVIEWQRRGTPHMHLAVYFPEAPDSETCGAPAAGVGGELAGGEVAGGAAGTTRSPAPTLCAALCPGACPLPRESASDWSLMVALIDAWMQVAEPYGVTLDHQHVARIDGPLGWLKYLSKHAARGAQHYQRQGHPEGWEKTGRLWGHTGEWPADPPMKFSLSKPAYWRYRRLVRSWRIANARAAGDWQRLTYARRMLSCPLPKLSAVRGVSEWISEDVAAGFLNLLSDEGHLIVPLES